MRRRMRGMSWILSLVRIDGGWEEGVIGGVDDGMRRMERLLLLVELLTT